MADMTDILSGSSVGYASPDDTSGGGAPASADTAAPLNTNSPDLDASSPMNAPPQQPFNSNSPDQDPTSFMNSQPNNAPKAPAQAQPSIWQRIFTGALVGLAGGAGAKNFGQGVAGGARASIEYNQQQTENQQKQQQLDQVKHFQDAESAFRAASLANQDKQLALQSQEAQDRHDANVMSLIKTNQELFGTTYDAVPNTSQAAMDWINQSKANSGGAGASIPAGTLVTSSTVYVPKQGTNSLEVQYKQATDLASALGLPAPTQQQFNMATPQQRGAIVERYQYQLMGKDPTTMEFYNGQKLPAVISNLQTNIKRYGADPNHNEPLLGIMKNSLVDLQSQQQAGVKATTDAARAEIPVAAQKAAAVATATTNAQLKAADQYAASTSAPDPNSNSILARTGLSAPAFAYLTGNASQLPRDKNTRTRAMKEAQDWANKNNVDISTMAAQYKAANDVVQKNIERLNNTGIMESELIGPDTTMDDINRGNVGGTIGNLKDVVKKSDLGNLNFTNVAKVWAGQQVNDPLAQQYAMHLSQLRNELSAYYAATQGRTGNNITVGDQKDAEQVIRNGVSSGSLQGLATAVYNSTTKMRPVMQTSVDAAKKQVWGLFGVTPPSSTTGKKEINVPGLVIH